MDLKGIKLDKRRNFMERIWFIKYWANYIKNNPDEKWSKGQASLINSQFQSARHFYENLGKTEKGREILLELMRKVIIKT